MTSTNRADELFQKILEKRAKRLGISIRDAAIVHPEESSLVQQAAEIRADRLGISASEILRRDLEALATSTFPTPDCLTSEDVQEYSETGRLSEELQDHLSVCEGCNGLIAAATVDPPGVQREEFVEEVRQMVISITAIRTSVHEEEVVDRRHVWSAGRALG